MCTCSTYLLTAPRKLFSSQPEFLERMEALAPDLCVTAAYGNMLPQRFLDIPKYGTPPLTSLPGRRQGIRVVAHGRGQKT